MNKPLEPKLIMIQIQRCYWQVQTPNGKVLRDNITISSVLEAKLYIENYISSFTNWGYDIMPIKKEK